MHNSGIDLAKVFLLSALLPLALLVWGAASPVQCRAMQPAPAPPERVLAVHPAGPEGEFVLGLEPCDGRSCPLTIGWRVAGAIRDKRILGWPFPPGEVSEDAAQEGSGVGDPLAGPGDTPAFSAGEEESAVTVAVTATRSPDGLPAVLVQQGAGFEHYKRRHEIYVAGGDPPLARVFAYQDPPGPTWSAVAVAKTAGGDAWILFTGTDGGTHAPDDLSVRRVALPGKGPAVLVDAPVAVLAVGAFASLDAARAAQQGCPSAAQILPGERLGAAAEPGYHSVFASTDGALAQEAAVAFAACAGRGVPVPVTLSWVGPRGDE